ncbi:MAG TPA: NAD(P)H-binding protein [Candidatus Limnocylindria bacterium]|nr:NAD(P)H-binding protein [Candidatus Limnocylindria bacterium]
MTAKRKPSSKPILVTGGRGTLGRLVVDRLLAAGRNVRILSRHDGSAPPGVEVAVGDLATGEGIDDAVEGVDTIVHCAGGQKGDDMKARHLVDSAATAGVRHIVYISVVGDERVPAAKGLNHAMFGYFDSKLGAERVLEASSVPWTTLHATQFYDLIVKVADAAARLPIVPLPSGFRFQPVDSGEVADRLVELALGEPAGLVEDIAGPRVYGMDELFRSYLEAADKSRPIVQIPMPGSAARAIREGAVLAPDHAVGRVTWEEFLTNHVRRAAA